MTTLKSENIKINHDIIFYFLNLTYLENSIYQNSGRILYGLHYVSFVTQKQNLKLKSNILYMIYFEIVLRMECNNYYS